VVVLLGNHETPQYGVHLRLVAAALSLEPIDDVLIEASRLPLFGLSCGLSGIAIDLARLLKLDFRVVLAVGISRNRET